MNIAARLEAMRIRHEDKALEELHADDAEQFWVDEEAGRILEDARQLGAACMECDPEWTILAAAESEARRRFEQMREEQG